MYGYGLAGIVNLFDLDYFAIQSSTAEVVYGVLVRKRK